MNWNAERNRLDAARRCCRRSAFFPHAGDGTCAAIKSSGSAIKTECMTGQSCGGPVCADTEGGGEVRVSHTVIPTRRIRPGWRGLRAFGGDPCRTYAKGRFFWRPFVRALSLMSSHSCFDRFFFY